MSETLAKPADTATGDNVPVPRGQYNLGVAALKVLDGLLTAPDSRPTVEKLIKEKFPDAKFADSDLFDSRSKPLRDQIEAESAARKALEQQITDMKKVDQDRLDAIEADKKAAKEKEFESDIASRLDAVKKKYGFQQEALEAVWKRMQEKNNPDVEAAAAFVSETTRKPPPLTGPNYLPQQLNVYGSHEKVDAYEQLHRDPWGYFDGQVRDIVANGPEAE
jgi:hypothetical protein